MEGNGGDKATKYNVPGRLMAKVLEMVAQEEAAAAPLSGDHTPQKEELVGVDNAKAIATAHDGVGGELMHISQCWTSDACGFRFVGVVRLRVWCNGIPEVDVVVQHAIPWDLLVAGAIKAKDGVELVHVHYPVDTK